MVKAVVNCGRVSTPLGSRPVGGPAMAKLHETQDAVIVIDEGGVILEVGPKSRVEIPEGADQLDAEGMLVVPGFVDPHTHLVFGGERSFEVEHKVDGKTYLEIQAMGGGIHRTVDATRRASQEGLVEGGRKRLNEMFRQGTTTVETKSGYGLDVETEVKMLRAIGQLKETAILEVVPTLLAAHALSPEFASSRPEFIRMVVTKMIPTVAEQGLATFVDAWCDEGAFTPAECQQVLEAGRAHGMGLRLHADELGNVGGARLAAEMHASSADHLLHAGPSDFRALRDANVVPVLAPAAPLVLFTHKWPDGRALAREGVPFALATDFNPNCQVLSMQRAMSLAVYSMHVKPKAALTAATLNAACSLERGQTVGTVEPGKMADLAVVDAETVDEFVTDMSTNRVHSVVKGGEIFYNR